MTQKAAGRKFKICLVTISLAGGGAERSCAMLSEMLFDKGHEVHVVTLNDRIDFPYKGKIHNLGKFKIGNGKGLSRFTRFKRLRRFLQTEGFDCVIDHRPKNKYFRELFYSKYLYRGIDSIYVFHSSNKAEYLTGFPYKFKKICNRNIANVAVSRQIAEEVLLPFGMKQVTYIPNAWDPSWIQQEANIPQEIGEAPFLLAYGRLVDHVKDFSFLIRAYSKSEVWKDNFHLLIMGEGPDRARLLELSNKLPGGARVKFIPYLNSPFGVVKKAHAVMLTSFYEGFPMVLIEALSLGVPVVSLDITSGPSEVIVNRKNGLLIEERSLSLFADSIKEICCNRELYDTCKKNAVNSVAAFSREQITNQWNQLLHEKIQ